MIWTHGLDDKMFQANLKSSKLSYCDKYHAYNAPVVITEEDENEFYKGALLSSDYENFGSPLGDVRISLRLGPPA